MSGAIFNVNNETKINKIIKDSYIIKFIKSTH